MKKLFIILCLLLVASPCYAVINPATVWEFRSTATANMLNGGGFNSANAQVGTDYSTNDTAHLTIADLIIGAGNTTVTSALTPFDSLDPGNILHITAGTNFTVGWYEVVSVTGGIATLDRACGTALATGGTAYLGGALNVGGSLEDDLMETVVAGNTIWMKTGTYTFSEAPYSSIVGTTTAPTIWAGYKTARGDNPTGTDRPILTGSATISFRVPTFWLVKNFIVTSEAASAFVLDGSDWMINCKVTNASGTANRNAISTGTFVSIVNCEAVCTNGYALSLNGACFAFGNYLHDSKSGIYTLNDYIRIINNIIDTVSTSGIYVPGATSQYQEIIGNTLYGAETPAGTGIEIPNADIVYVANNIIYGFAIGVSQTAVNRASYFNYNNFYNNTVDRSNVTVGDNDLALDPQFVDAPNADFRIGVNLKARGFPGVFYGAHADCIGYLDTGAVQRVEPTAGGGSTVGHGYSN